MQIPLDQVTDSLRHVGKTLNFATGYGAGAERIAAVAGVTKKRGQQFLDRYYAEFSALEPWKKRVLQEARDRCDTASPVTNPPYVIIEPSGRIRRLPELLNYYSGDEWVRYRAERQAINAVVQGFASNIAKLAMISLHEQLLDLPAQMLVQVHDEVVIKVDKRYLDMVLPIVQDTMSGVLNPQGDPILGEIPLVVSTGVGYTWADAKGK
jgi:DNA polymerase-1